MPLIEWFGMLVAKVIIISIILVVTVLVTGITFSSIIIGIKDWICDMIEANKNEYKNIKAKNAKNSEKFKKIMSQTDIVEAAEQLNFELEDDDEDEEKTNDLSVS